MHKAHIFIYLALAILLGLFLVVNPLNINSLTSITTSSIYSPEEPSISLNLTKTAYSQNQELEGILTLEISAPIDSFTKIKAELNNQVDELNLTTLLDNLGYTYFTSESQISAISPSTTKTLSLTANSPKKLAFKLPRTSTVTNINMNLAGTATFPYLDVNSDSYKEWQYFGNFLNFKTEKLSPSTLSTSSTGSIAVLISPNNYYCEIISLPYSKNYRIFSNYKKITSGDIKATILSYSIENSQLKAEGGADICDLPENTNLDWHSCDLSLTKALSGNHLVCLFTSAAGNYEITRDNTASTNAYSCGSLATGTSNCNSQSTDYYIQISGADYSKTLPSSINFQDSFTSYSFKNSLTDYLTNCIADEINECAVPFSINSETDGSISLSNLRIDYTEGTTQAYTSLFYDLSSSPSTIYEINYINLSSSYNLTIPLSTFNITTPEISNDEDEFDLEITLTPGSTIDEEITVTKTTSPSTINSSLSSILSKKSNLNSLLTKNKDILDILGYTADINSALTSLTKFQNEIINLNTSNKTTSEKTLEISRINSNITSLTNSLPSSIDIKAIVEDNLIITPNDITPELLSMTNQKDSSLLYQEQDKFKIQIKAQAFTLKKFSGASTTSTIIKKTITGRLTNAYIVEDIPKTIASSSSLIFETEPEIVKQDPIVRWLISSSASETISYLITGNVISKINSLKTIIVPKEITIPLSAISVCGDNKCTTPLEDKVTCPEDCSAKIPWLWIIILLIIAILGIYYLNFYKGKYGFKELTGEKLFKSKTDYTNLKNYIKKSLSHNLARAEITKQLLEKNWTPKQINFVFDELKKEAKEAEKTKKAEEKKPV